MTMMMTLVRTMMMTMVMIDHNDDSPFSVPISVYSACQLLHSGWWKIESNPSVTRLSSTSLIRMTVNMVLIMTTMMVTTRKAF